MPPFISGECFNLTIMRRTNCYVDCLQIRGLCPGADNTEEKSAKLNYLSCEVFVSQWFIMCELRRHHGHKHSPPPRHKFYCLFFVPSIIYDSVTFAHKWRVHYNPFSASAVQCALTRPSKTKLDCASVDGGCGEECEIFWWRINWHKFIKCLTMSSLKLTKVQIQHLKAIQA